MVYTLEVPLFNTPSRRAKNFFKMVENPTSTGSLMGMYWKGNLSFTYYDEDKNYKAIIKPVDEAILSPTAKRRYDKKISIFISKLNGATALIGKDCEVNVHLIEDLSDEAKKMYGYGKNIAAMIIVTVNAKNTATEVAINTFFTVVEKSPLNLV